MREININSKEVSGIYLIYNTVSNKGYIGSSINIIKRIYREHLVKLRGNKHTNKRLQNSWNKHGGSSFKIYVLAECPSEYLIKLEQWFIDNYKSEYNILRLAGTTLGYKHSDEAKLSMSINSSGEKNPNYNKKGKLHHRAYIIACYKLNGELYKLFYTVREAFEEMNINTNNIWSAVKTNKNNIKQTAGGYYWISYNNLDEVLNNIEPYKSSKTTNTIIAEDMNVCHIFNGYTEAITYIGCSKTPIKNYIMKNKNDLLYGYKWRIK